MEGPLNECFWVNQANELDEQKKTTESRIFTHSYIERCFANFVSHYNTRIVLLIVFFLKWKGNCYALVTFTEFFDH